MSLIGNEILYAKKLLNGVIKTTDVKNLIILARYFCFHEKQNNIEAKKNLFNYAEQNDFVVSDKVLDSIILQVRNDRIDLHELD